jgi:hypothetical protein
VKRGKTRRKVSTVLDDLEADGIVSESDARELRSIHNRDPGPLTPRETLALQLLLYSIMAPARPDSRLAARQKYAMSYERAYYSSLGRQDATAATAKKWGVTSRTVRNAVSENTIQMLPDKTRSPELREVFEVTRKRLKKPARRRTRK